MNRRETLAALLFAALMVLGTGVAQAAPPANDDFAAATSLGVGEEVSGSSFEATVEPGEPNHSSVSSVCPSQTDRPDCIASVWFTFVPPSMGAYTIETCDMGTDFDTVLGLYTGTKVSGTTEVAANDDGGECAGGGGKFGSRISFESAAGVPYHLALAGFNGARGSFYVRAYAGTQQARPKPDTGIIAGASILAAMSRGEGVHTGPRHSPSFAVESDLANAGFECSLDGAAFAPCAPPVSYPELAPGTAHEFKARAVVGAAIDPTPAIERFTLDPAPPETTIASGPSGAFPSQSPSWTSISTEQTSRTGWLCGLDAGHDAFCGATTELHELCQGHHAYSTAAVDLAGNLDPSPAGAGIDVTVGPPCVAPTVGAPSLTTKHPTRVDVVIPVDNAGAGALVRFEYGLTAAYGMEDTAFTQFPQKASPEGFVLRFLAPGTEYHYRVTVTTPFGSATTGDQTVSTEPLSGTLPVPQNAGAPVVSAYAAAIPTTIDAKGVKTFYSLLISSKGPVTPRSTSIGGVTPLDGTAVGPEARTIQIADLEPNTVYRYRVAAMHSSALDSNEALAPEGTFRTLALPTPPAIALSRKRFRLRRGNIKLTPLSRRSERLRLRVKGLPAKTVVKAKLLVGGSKQTARKRADKKGRARFRPALSKRIRKAFLKKKVRRYRVKVTASPPGERPSSVTLTKTLKR